MPSFCAVYGCSNRHDRDKKSYFRLPRPISHQGEKTSELSTERRGKWLSNIARADIKPSSYNNLRVCSDHFVTGKPSALYDKANVDWAPTVDLGHEKSYTNCRRRVKKKRSELGEAANALLLLQSKNELVELIPCSTEATGARSMSSTSNGVKQTFTVCVEGNIASGKTRLIEYFKKYNGIVEVLEEPTKKWRDIQGHNALAKMYEDPSRWGAIFQSYSQLTMLQLHTQPQKSPVKLMERSLYSGRYCFIENLHKSKIMPDLDYTVLCEWFNWIVTSQNVHVDLIVYLQTQPAVLQERIKARLRPEEQAIPIKYLEDLHVLHEDWLVNKTSFKPPAPVLVLDANQDLQTMFKKFEEEKSRILFGLAGT